MNPLKKLIEVFGVPSRLETGCFIGGRNGHRILRRKTRGAEETGLFLGGPMGNSIILGSQRIGTVAFSSARKIYTLKGVKTNYFVGGPNGRDILYLKRKNKKF